MKKITTLLMTSAVLSAFAANTAVFLDAQPDWMALHDKAVELGLISTSFRNPTGLHHDEHVTTCREMASIMIAAKTGYRLEARYCLASLFVNKFEDKTYVAVTGHTVGMHLSCVRDYIRLYEDYTK